MVFAGAAEARPGYHRVYVAQLSPTLPPHLVRLIQRKFNGRIIDVTSQDQRPNSQCRPFSKTVAIASRPVKTQGMACLDDNGIWQTQLEYDVQVLTADGQVIIVTVNSSTKEIIKVQQ